MLLLKTIASALMVITITGVAERISPRFAGVLLGFPLGVGLSLFFIGIEQGPQFASSSALWSIQGLIASLVFCLAYKTVTARLSQRSRRSIPAAAGSAMAAYFICTGLLMYLPANDLRLRFILVALALFLASLLFRTGLHQTHLNKIRMTPFVIGSRAMAATASVLLITETASLVGPKWSGLFAAFPTTILPAVVILHYHYGPKAVAPLFVELPQGMLAIIIFSHSIHIFFPVTGVYIGTILAYLVAGVYLIGYEFTLRKPLNSFLDSVMDSIRTVFAKNN